MQVLLVSLGLVHTTMNMKTSHFCFRDGLYLVWTVELTGQLQNRGILAEVIVYIFAHLHRVLRTEGNVLDINWLQEVKELVEFNTWWKF